MRKVEFEEVLRDRLRAANDPQYDLRLEYWTKVIRQLQENWAQTSELPASKINEN